MAAPERFSPVQSITSPPGPPPQNSRNFPVLPVFLVIVYFFYLVLAIIGPKVSSQIADELDPIFPSNYRLIGAGVLFVLFAVVIIWSVFLRSSEKVTPPQNRSRSRPAPKPAPVQTPPISENKFKPVAKPPELKKEQPAVQKKIEEKKASQPQVIIYPLEVEGGIFGDTYIQLSNQKVLKLRSLVVEPEHLS